jgi:hypothetical protein
MAVRRSASMFHSSSCLSYQESNATNPGTLRPAQ